MAANFRLFSSDGGDLSADTNESFFSPGEQSFAPMEKDLRKQLGLKKSIQVLEQSASPSYRAASPLLKVAGTPVPYLPSNKLKNDMFDEEEKNSSPFELCRKTLNKSSRTPLRNNTSLSQHSFAVLADKTQTLDTTHFSVLLEKDPVLEGGGELFNEFLQLYTNHPHSADVFELVEQYEEVCRKNIKSLLIYINKTDPTRKRLKKTLKLLNQLYDECYTWRLLASLLRDRILSETMDLDVELDELPTIDSARSEKVIVDRLFERDAAIRQCQIIVDWLEKNMQDKLEDLLATENINFHSDSIYWEHTIHDLCQLQMGSKDPSLATNLVTEIDPDAPVRQQRSLSSLDQQDEEQLLLYMFRFIRAGKLEEAQKLCSEQGHFWRAASLNGWRLWHDPNYFNADGSDDILPAEGNPDRDIWKLNCWALANEKGCSLHEKAMYAALSGHLQQLLPACNSWEDCLWAYFKVLVDVRVEQEIRNHPRTTNDFIDLPQPYWEQVQTNDLTPRGIIGQLKSHPNIDIRKQCVGTYRIFQTNIILNEIDDFLMEMKNIVNSDIDDPHLIRFMAHLVLFLQAVGIQTQEEICVEVLYKYVQVLIETKQNNLVAVYTARLPSDMQTDVYAKFLEGIQDSESRELYLGLAEEAGLELKHITKQIVENIRSKDYTLDESDSSKGDEIKINSVDWLIFDASQRAEALKQANAIIRGFLAARKHDASQMVFSKLPADSIDVIHKQWRKRAGEKVLPAEDDNAIREYLCIKGYLQAHDVFNAWFDHFHHQEPVEPKQISHRTFKEQVAFEESMKEYKADFERWHKTLDSHVKSTSECIYNVLIFPGGWMVDDRQDLTSTDENRSQQLHLLRQQCIPYLTFLLHSVLQSNKQYRECMQLAEIVQSKRYRLYEVFQKQELQKFLHLLRESSIALLEEGYDAFGFEK